MFRNTWTRVTSVMTLVMVIVLAGSAMAAAKKSFPLMGQEDSPRAKGTATVQDTRLTVTANGLKPSALHTVWFVNMQPTMTKEGAGTSPFTFKTNQKGSAKYVTTLKDSPIGKWQAIFIIRHPSGNPTDMDHIEDALMAKLM